MGEAILAYMIVGVLALSYRFYSLKEMVAHAFDEADDETGFSSTPLIRTATLCAFIVVMACAWPIALIGLEGGGSGRG